MAIVGREGGPGLEESAAQPHILHKGASITGRLHAQHLELLRDVINGHLVTRGAGLSAQQAVVG